MWHKEIEAIMMKMNSNLIKIENDNDVDNEIETKPKNRT